jgi:hypothetical protein
VNQTLVDEQISLIRSGSLYWVQEKVHTVGTTGGLTASSLSGNAVVNQAVSWTNRSSLRA